MTVKEKLERIARELYDWEGRYGNHKTLWKDLADTEQAPYLEEALFLYNEFFLSLLIEEIKGCDMTLKEILEAMQNAHPEGEEYPKWTKLDGRIKREVEAAIQAHTQKIIKRLREG